ncbi:MULTISPECIES: hypothetical protein [Actinomadura]|uniref:Uncharacterized protein n=1 Tax=Actinomadura yumaensis TaxID=111807 RepID=A0ABW2CCM1_9ACTN|nr:hypothetical protein [Actinomadura sp. J1-007]
MPATTGRGAADRPAPDHIVEQRGLGVMPATIRQRLKIAKPGWCQE